jgi:hypothetical protein
MRLGDLKIDGFFKSQTMINRLPDLQILALKTVSRVNHNATHFSVWVLRRRL